ncbi:TPA: DNA replication protein [Klebsiella variicola]|uniref:DNA replication protein n=1 Tax=Klebsiella variicola TaxID=244366 RepID=UPI001FB1D95F|nr:DNA replication protein [Klebsiella variicola]MCJ0888766.1 DNA replication protein [Klebsiella variicola]
MEKPQPSGQGLVFLHRKVRELPFYKTDSEAVHLWIHLIMEVNSADGMVTTEFGEYPVSRGQVITGRHTLSKDTGIAPDRVKYLLNKFAKMGMITTLANKKFTLLTVTKYDDYQQFFVPTECQQSANANPVTTLRTGEVVPTECQQSANANPVTTLRTGEVVPTECQQSATNNILNNISSTDVEESASASQKLEPKKPSLSCEQVVEVYHRVLPEAQGIRILTDKRRNLIRSFWQKANKITRQLDGHCFTLADWESYLSYIASNCRWMLENRPDQRTGKTWRRKSLEYFLNVDVYAKTREGACDDL